MKNRIGETNTNNYGSLMTIVEYKNNKDIVVEFECGYKVDTIYSNFKKGSILSVYDKDVCGIGYIGEGDYKVRIDGKINFIYACWRNMLVRCYDEKSLKKYPTYIGCSVCEEWHCYQTFAKWFDENYYTYNNQKMNLDKDIINKANKIYSPDTCVFVPQNINKIFTKRQNHRGEYPIGVFEDKDNGKFISMCSVYKNGIQKREFLGRHDTPELAFYKYKFFKENYIKEVAKENKDIIPERLYNAMIEYKVEITD